MRERKSIQRPDGSSYSDCDFVEVYGIFLTMVGVGIVVCVIGAIQHWNDKYPYHQGVEEEVKSLRQRLLKEAADAKLRDEGLQESVVSG